MKSIVVALVLSSVLFGLLALETASLPLLLTAPVMVAAGIVASSISQSGLTWMSVSAGAISVLVLQWMPHPTLLRVSLCVFLWLTPRVFLARSPRHAIAQAGVALASSLLAGLIVSEYLQAPTLQQFAACVFAGAALTVATLVIRVDLPVAHGLHAAALRLQPEIQRPILEACDVLRLEHAEGHHGWGVSRDWRLLLTAVEKRVALTTTKDAPTSTKLDTEILRLVSVCAGVVVSNVESEESENAVPQPEHES